ncbi:UNKNOWN [Stylonychia lemnae]|uniref:Uncharacterized protein n=1 Tax=Stylonychia lemnae TaxID=5949 RepID=A0A077ZX34_STYLE|nr:UNKNOWN [Stylonychia lemnae]|eukprot:CDW73076.1 UNKNOWN [Stylonychia lemnae]
MNQQLQVKSSNDNLSSGGEGNARPSNALTSFKDTSSLFTISNDSNIYSGQNDGPDNGGFQGTNQLRSKRIKRDQKQKSSKTERFSDNHPGQTNEEKKNSPNDAMIEVRAVANQKDKPFSARSNNLEVWLAKKKAFDQQSKQSQSNKEINPSELKELHQLQNNGNESERDLSYLSKLQSSLFFEPGAQFKDKSELIEQEKLRTMQKSDSQFNLKTIQQQQLQLQQQKQGTKLETLNEQESSNRFHRSQQSKQMVQQVYASNAGSESLLIFNPKEEAILDSYPNMLSISQNKMLKEVIDHVQKENQYLKDQLLDQQELVKMHKQMLVDIISSQNTKIDEFIVQGKSLNQKLNDQRQYLMMNNNIFDNSQVSFMTADLDIHDMDIFKNDSSRRYTNNILGEFNIVNPPSSQLKMREDEIENSHHSLHNHPNNVSKKSSLKEQNLNNSDYCLACKHLIESERQEFKTKQDELLGVIDQLKQDFAIMMQQKEQLMKSQISQGMSSNNLFDQDGGLNSARSQLNNNDIMKSPKPLLSHSRQESGSEKFDGVEQALQPLLEKITDPSEEIYFQDSNGRVFKIMMCEANNDEIDINQIEQYENYQAQYTEEEETSPMNLEQQKNSQSHVEAPLQKINNNQYNSARQSSVGIGSGSLHTAATSNLANSGMLQMSNQKGSIMNSTGNNNTAPVRDDINPVQTEEYYYDEEEDENEIALGGLTDQISPSRNRRQYDFRDFDQDDHKNSDFHGIYQTNPKTGNRNSSNNHLQIPYRKSDEDFNLLSEGEVENDLLNHL